MQWRFCTLEFISKGMEDKREKGGLSRTDFSLEKRRMQPPGELRRVLTKLWMRMNLEELLGKNMSVYDKNSESENSVK